MKLRTTKAQSITVVVSGITVTGSPLQSSEIADLRAKHTKIKQGVEVTDGAGLTVEMFDREVIAWDAKSMETGEPIPCTPEQKRIVWENNPDFVGEVMAKLTATANAERSAVSGNSQPGVSGTSPKGK